MNGLQAFLQSNAIKVENIKYSASKRFLDQDKKPVLCEIGSITTNEDERLRKECTKRVQMNNKKGQFTQETDFNLYLGKLAAKCTIYPNLNDVELQNSYSVMGADTLLKTMLTPGEYADYLAKVQEINGFDTSFEEMVDDAKN